MRTSDCSYHNCTAPLPPPSLDPFDCWKPNASNVSWLPPVLFRNPHYDEANENTTYFRTTVHCIRPSWPDADGIWCLTPHSALFCPFPDQYRGNRTELQADTEATTRSADPFSPLYVNDTSLRCHSWKVDDVYDSLASQRALFPLKPHSSTTAHLCSEGNWSACKCPNATVWPRCDRRSRPRRIEPWERPCDRYDYVAVGVHTTRAHARPRRDARPRGGVARRPARARRPRRPRPDVARDKSQLRSWHLQSIDAAADAKAALEYEERAASRSRRASRCGRSRSRRRRPPPAAGTRYGYRGHDEHADVCVGEGHTCALWRAPLLNASMQERDEAGAQTTRRRQHPGARRVWERGRRAARVGPLRAESTDLGGRKGAACDGRRAGGHSVKDRVRPPLRVRAGGGRAADQPDVAGVAARARTHRRLHRLLRRRRRGGGAARRPHRASARQAIVGPMPDEYFLGFQAA